MSKVRTAEFVHFPLDSFVMPRAPGQYDAKRVSDETAISCPEPTLTQQQFKHDGDLNSIMDKFHRTNDLSLFMQGRPNYGDFTGVNDLHTSLNIVLAGQQAFDDLPARIRTRFDNDVLKFADFLNNPSNFAEAKDLGLLRPDAKSMLDAPRLPGDEPPPAQPPQQRSVAGGGSSPGA